MEESTTEDRLPPSENRKARPIDSNFRQQSVKAWIPILTPPIVAAWLVLLAAVFFPIGARLLASSKSAVTIRQQYDGSGTPSQYDGCKITDFDQSASCQVTFNIDKDMTPPVFVHYELDSFYQNHRKYVRSRSSQQLLGRTIDTDTDCDPKRFTDEGYKLNPCGLIANSLFTDRFTVSASTGEGFSSATPDSPYMSEADIAWDQDQDERFAQPDAFAFAKVEDGGDCAEASNSTTNCEACLGSGKSPCVLYLDTAGDTFLYYYKDDVVAHGGNIVEGDGESSRPAVQYLYSSFPDIVSPLEGVENEHFQVWMRAAGLPTFRKIYGRITSPLRAGDTLTFSVDASYFVQSFSGKKSIVLSTVGRYGGKNMFLSVMFLIGGSLCLVLAAAFLALHAVRNRRLGDPRFVDAAQYLVVPNDSSQR